MSILITIHQKGARVDTIEKMLRGKIQEKFPEARISFERKEPPTSRANRFAEAQGLISEGKAEIESLRDELQEWFDNLPENFQQGDKGSQLEDAISNLEELISELENAESQEVEFPGMY